MIKSMKNRRRLLLIASLPLAAIVALWVAALLSPRDGVTKANFNRIQKGMTKPEVENIFGQESTMLAPCGRDVANLWRDSEGDRNAYVFFDKNERVLSTSWIEASVSDKIRRVLQFR
jgi:hypothetical protein